MSILKFFGASVLALGLGVSASSAATLNVVGGELFGATDVDVGGALYDVSFMDGTCIALFGGCDDVSDFTFTSEAEATTAAQALLDQVLVDGPLGQFGSVTNAINGIEDSNNASVVTIYGFNPFSPSKPAGESARRSTGPADGTIAGEFGFFPQSDLFSTNNAVWAVWSESQVVVTPNPVPLPAGGILMLSGLAAVAGLRRRKKNKA